MPDIPLQLGDDPNRYARQVATDALVQQTRDATPAGVADQRAVKRLSIGELNSMDLPAIKNIYQSTRLDTRGPVTRFLDLLDLPRNTIANIVFPNIASEQKDVGEVGTFGMGKVSFSDALRKMGVENRIALGVGGFVGDVLMDPLTYLGPAGWGAKGVSSAGRVAEVGKAGAKILEESRLAALSGRAIADPDIARAVKALGIHPEGVAAMRTAGKTDAEIADLINKQFNGLGQTRMNKVLSRVGEPIESTESLLARSDPFQHAETPADREVQDAMRSFTGKYGMDAKPGLRIGRTRDPKTGLPTGPYGVEWAGPGEVGNIPSGSTVAHIPFTEYGVHVPGFSQDAKYAIALGPVLRATEDAVANERINKGRALYESYAQHLSDLKDNFNALNDLDKADVAAGHAPVAVDSVRTSTDPLLRETLTAQNGDLVERIKAIHDEMLKTIAHHEEEAVAGLSTPGEILGYGRLSESFDAALNKLDKDLKGNPLFAGNAIDQNEYAKFRTLVGTRAERLAAQKIKDAEAIRQAKTDAYAETFRQSQRDKMNEAQFMRQRGDEIAAPYQGVVHGLENSATEGRDVSVSGGIGDAGGIAGEGSSGVGGEGSPSGRVVAKEPDLRTPDTKEYNRAGILKKLQDKSRLIGTTNQDVAMLEGDENAAYALGRDAFTGAFDGPLPKIVREHIKKNPKDAKYFQANVPKGNGTETLHHFGEDVEEMIKGLKGQARSESQKDVKELADKIRSVTGDPEAAFLANMHADIEGAAKLREKLPPLRVVKNPAESIHDGAELTVAGRKYRVTQDGDGVKWLVDADDNAHPLHVFDELPIDKGSLVQRSAAEINAERLLHEFGEVAPPHASSTPLESEAAAAMAERKVHHDMADALEKQAREHGKIANEIASGKAAEAHAEILDGANPNDPVTHANWNYLRQRYGDMPTDLIAPVNKEELTAEATRAALEQEHQGLQAAKQDLMNSSPETMAAKQQLADLLHGQLEAAKKLADTIQAPLYQTITGTSNNMVKAAEMALGVDPGTIGANAFMPLAAATSGIMGDKFDAAARDLAYYLDKFRRAGFGEKSGIPHELVRRWAREVKGGGDTMRVTLDTLFADTRNVMAKYKIPTSELDEFQKTIGLVRDVIHNKNTGIYGKGDEIWSGILEAEARGWFDEALHPGLKAEFERMAQGLIDAEAKMGIAEQRAGLLGKLEEGHSSFVKTREAAQAISAQKKVFEGLSPSAQDALGKVIESFQQKRTSFKQHVLNPDGTEAGWFMLGERDYVNSFNAKDLDTLRNIDPVMVKAIEDRKALIEQYDAAMALDNLSQPHPERQSVFSINKMTQEGLYGSLTGGADMPRGFFEENPAIAMAARAASHEKAKIRLMMDQVAIATGMPLNKARIQNFYQDGGKTYAITDNGVKLRFTAAKGNSPAYFELGNQRYRYPDKDILSKSHDILSMNGSKFESTIVPEHVAEALENIYKSFAKESDIHEVLKAIDTMTGVWKGLTLGHPSWTIGNISGAIIQMLSMGISPAQMVKYAWQAGKLAFNGHNPEVLSKIAIDGQFGRLTGAQWLKDAEEGRAIRAGTSNEAAGHMLLANGDMVLPHEQSLLRNPKGAFREMHDRVMQQQKAAVYGGIMSRVPYHKQLAYLKGMALDEIYANRLLKTWFGVNGRIEDWSRLIAYAALRDKGMDASSATAKIIEGMFDFSDLTNTEQTVFRRLLPFYAWTRNSAAYGIKMLLENPKYHTLVPKVKDAIEQMFAGEQQVPEHARPRWMREQLALQVGADPEKRSALLIGSYLPQEGGMRLGSAIASPVLGQASLQDGIAYLGMGINPLFRVPLEVAAGRELYTGRVISGDENQGDLTVGEHFLNQVRPFRELGVGNIRQGALQSAFSRSPGEGVERLLVGGRSQPFTQERIDSANMREYTDRVNNIRKKINLAEREKNHGASQKARAALLQTYASMKKAKLKIPKWADKQLKQI